MTAVTGIDQCDLPYGPHECHATMISPDDFALARDYVRGTANTAKWNKPHFQAAAAGMAWLIRELPGSPRLMNKLLDLLKGDNRTTAVADATNLIRAQFGLDASVLTTSTQAPGLDEFDVSSIPNNQAAYGAGAGGGSRLVLASNGGDDDEDVCNGTEDSSFAPGRTALSAAAAAAAVVPPAPAAAGDPGEGGSAAAAGAAAAAAGAAAAGAAAAATAAAAHTQKYHVHKTLHKTHARGANPNKIPICSYLWRRMLCRRTNCQSLHPDLCSSPTCIPNRAPTCNRFHGHYREEKPKDFNQSKPKPNQGNGRRGAPPPSNPPPAAAAAAAATGPATN